MLRNGADPNLKDSEEKTALPFASEIHGLDSYICWLLLGNGADPNLKDSEEILYCHDKKLSQWQRE